MEENADDNELVVVGKTCDVCHIAYDPDVECCLKCGNDKLSEITQSAAIMEIYEKERKKTALKTAFVLILIMLGLLAYMIIRIYLEGGF